MNVRLTGQTLFNGDCTRADNYRCFYCCGAGESKMIAKNFGREFLPPSGRERVKNGGRWNNPHASVNSDVLRLALATAALREKPGRGDIFAVGR